VNGPLVSAVIPAYNAGPLIEDAVRSALAQTYPHLEVIVVDDGSTDDTCARVAAFESRVTLIRQANAGCAAARNTGIRRSRGTYVASLDADDVWFPEKIASVVQAFEQDDQAGAVYHWWSFVGIDGKAGPQIYAPVHNGDVVEPLLMGNFLSPSAVTIRRTCLDQVGLCDPSVSWGEDYDLFLRMALAGHRFQCVPKTLARIRLSDRSMTSNPARQGRGQRAVLDRAFDSDALPARLRMPQVRASAYQTLLVNTAMSCLWRGHLEDARAFLLEGVSIRPEALERPGFYVGLALRTLPAGYQTWQELTNRMDAVVPRLTGLLHALFATPGLPPEVEARRRIAWSAVWMAFGLIHAAKRRWSRATAYFGRSLVDDPLTIPMALGRGLRGNWRSVRAALGI